MNYIIAIATVQLILLLLVLARILTFDFGMVSTLFSVRAWYMQKLDATIKINDIDTTTAFASHMSN